MDKSKSLFLAKEYNQNEKKTEGEAVPDMIRIAACDDDAQFLKKYLQKLRDVLLR